MLTLKADTFVSTRVSRMWARDAHILVIMQQKNISNENWTVMHNVVQINPWNFMFLSTQCNAVNSF